MKIAVLSCFYPYRGGISQFNAELYKELGKVHDVRAFNFSRQYPDILFPGKTQYVEKEDNAVPIQSEAVLDTANPFTYATTARKIAKWEPDLLIMRYWMSYFAPSQGTVAKKVRSITGGRTKVISIVDNLIPHEKRFFDTVFTKYYLKHNDGFVTLCNAVKEDLLKVKPDAKCIVSPHPLYSQFGNKLDREDARRKLGIPANSRTILFFGLIREYKGLDILIKAFSGLGNEYTLVIAGEPYGSFEKYAGLISECKNRDNIILRTEYIRDNDVAAYFSASDVVVLPYRSATQSGITAISYHFGIPMITTDTGGLKESIGERGTGIVVDRADVQLIRNAIISLFSDYENKSAAFAKAIQAEKERLSWSNFCNNLISFANSL